MPGAIDQISEAIGEIRAGQLHGADDRRQLQLKFDSVLEEVRGYRRELNGKLEGYSRRLDDQDREIKDQGERVDTQADLLDAHGRRLGKVELAQKVDRLRRHLYAAAASALGVGLGILSQVLGLFHKGPS